MKAFLFFLFTVIVSNLYSQNMVRNHDFSEVFDWQKRNLKQGWYDRLDSIAPHWFSATRATPDFFCCSNESKRRSSVPKNVAGFSYPQSGLGYIGIVLAYPFKGYPKKGEYREYIQTKLKQPLERGRKYCVGFYVKSASEQKYFTKNIGLYLSTKGFNKFSMKSLKFEPQIKNKNTLIDDSKWHLIQQVYNSKGAEHYLIIGNFDNYNNTTIIEREYEDKDFKENTKASTNAYVFLDNVFVYPINDSSECFCKTDLQSEDEHALDQATDIQEESFSPGDQITLPDITFEVNKSNLAKSALPILDSLAVYLNKYSDYEINIEGHTDSIGSAKHNIRLSFERADAVKSYLISKGVNENQIKAEGKGSENPISDNGNEKGREKNRRVEILIIGKE